MFFSFTLCYKCTCIYICKPIQLTEMHILRSKMSNLPSILVIVTIVHMTIIV